MEAVAPHALLVQRVGQGVAVGHLGMAAMEGGVEAGDLGNPGAALADHADGRQVVGLVQRRQRGVGIQPRQDVVIDQHRLGQLGAAVHHAMAHGQRRAAEVAAEPGAHDFLAIGHIGRVAGGDVALDQRLAGGIAHPQARVRGADAFELAAQARRQLLLPSMS